MLYPAVVIGWHGRKALAKAALEHTGGRIVGAMKEAIVCYGAPEVFNTD